MLSKNKRNKLRNIKTNGFDSKGEYRRYLELCLMAKQGIIANLKTQPKKFVLWEGFRYKGNKLRDITYTPDFSYIDTKSNQLIYEDFKSDITAKQEAFKIKSKMFQKIISKLDNTDFVITGTKNKSAKIKILSN
jgi:hypothetical protein